MRRDYLWCVRDHGEPILREEEVRAQAVAWYIVSAPHVRVKVDVPTTRTSLFASPFFKECCCMPWTTGLVK